MDEKEKLIREFEKKIKKEFEERDLEGFPKNISDLEDSLNSVDYEKFRLEVLPRAFSVYEKLCYYSEKLLNLKPDKKTEQQLNEEIYDAHLEATPTGILSFSVLLSLIIIIIALSFMVVIDGTMGFGFFVIGIGAYFAGMKLPKIFANKIKAKSNDEIIISIFYIVSYMRFNSNLELAINFAAQHLSPPLSLDFKRILWELENSKYPSIKEALDKYLEKWREDNLEFLEAIYMIEASLYETEDYSRISLLDKSLNVILEGNYEKMLHFAQNLKSKVQTFNMMGIVLPILALIILPLLASMGDPKTIWEVTIQLYVIIIPVVITYLAFNIVYNRPSAVNSIRPPKNIKRYKNLMSFPIKLTKKKTIYLNPRFVAIFLLIIFILVGLIPIIIHTIDMHIVANQQLNNNNNTLQLIGPIEKNLNNFFRSKFGEKSPFGYFQNYHYIEKTNSGYVFGPYGVYPGLFSLFLVLGITYSITIFFRYKYRYIIHLRDNAKRLEKEFSSATFQLGNRINEGISAELAFGMVTETMKDTEVGKFFSNIDKNIKFEGMSVERAVFDSEKGAILDYPSDLIESSMRLIIKTLDKGPEITAKILIDISKYLSDIHHANERLLDLLSDSISSMRSQASFLSPVISGVVIAIISLITMILGSLKKVTNNLQSSQTASSGLANFLGYSIPTYLLQPVIGIYLIILIVVIIYTVTSLENGEDKINTKYQIGQKLLKSITKYLIVVIIGIIIFNIIGGSIMGSM